MISIVVLRLVLVRRVLKIPNRVLNDGTRIRNPEFGT